MFIKFCLVQTTKIKEKKRLKGDFLKSIVPSHGFVFLYNVVMLTDVKVLYDTHKLESVETKYFLGS